MVKITQELIDSLSEASLSTNHPKHSEKLCYIRLGQWAVPLTKHKESYGCALGEWDETSLDMDGHPLNEVYDGVIVYEMSSLSPRTSKDVSQTIDRNSLIFILTVIKKHGISYPRGTEQSRKLTMRQLSLVSPADISPSEPTDC